MVQLHGFLQPIVSYCDLILLVISGRNFFTILVQSFMNLANHPDMNGQIKVLNRNLHAESYIGTFEALV